MFLSFNRDTKILDDIKCHKVFELLLQSLDGLFFSYLTNRELGKLDITISDKNLRKLYHQYASIFYLNNQVQSLDELKWIMTRRIVLTKCYLDFEFDGKLS